jgi:SAM-dependent methyltransferase
MHWRVKGVIQMVLSPLPGGAWLHYRLQRSLGGLRNFGRELDIKVDDWTIMVGHLRDARLPLAGARLLEIGTGWYPTFPFACYLAGARTIHTLDLTRHLKPDLVRTCVARLEQHLPRIAEAGGAGLDAVRARYRMLADRIGEGNDLARATDGAIVYAAPADAGASGLPADSINAVFSNSVLEHVHPDVIAPLYREAMRILVPGGVMFHSVNCGDHYAYVDRSVSQLNYLRYSDRQWRRWDNEFLYQNRLRAHVFVDRAVETGFELALNAAVARPERLRQLQAIPVHAQFAHIPAEQLCITSVDFIGRKPMSG